MGHLISAQHRNCWDSNGEHRKPSALFMHPRCTSDPRRLHFLLSLAFSLVLQGWALLEYLGFGLQNNFVALHNYKYSIQVLYHTSFKELKVTCLDPSWSSQQPCEVFVSLVRLRTGDCPRSLSLDSCPGRPIPNSSNYYSMLVLQNDWAKGALN